MEFSSNSGLVVAVAVAFLVLAIVGVIAILRAGGASRAAGEEAARRGGGDGGPDIARSSASSRS